MISVNITSPAIAGFAVGLFAVLASTRLGRVLIALGVLWAGIWLWQHSGPGTAFPIQVGDTLVCTEDGQRATVTVTFPADHTTVHWQAQPGKDWTYSNEQIQYWIDKGKIYKLTNSL